MAHKSDKASTLFVAGVSLAVAIFGLVVSVLNMQLAQQFADKVAQTNSGQVAGATDIYIDDEVTSTSTTSGTRICRDEKTNIQVTVPASWKCNLISGVNTGTFAVTGDGISFAFNYGTEAARSCYDDCTKVDFYDGQYIQVVTEHIAGEEYRIVGESKAGVRVSSLEINYNTNQTITISPTQKEIILQVLQSIKPLN